MVLKKYLYINTIGCQMNIYDSEQIAMQLVSSGYEQTSSLGKADLVILNTCSIRAKAEQKAFSFLGRLAKLKRQKPRLIVGVGGCVAQQEGKKLLKRVPHLDIVFGTRAVNRLPALIKKIEADRCRIVDVEMTASMNVSDSMPMSQDASPVSRFITVMRGCDNFCSYCVVPYVRGRETSRHPERIINEVRGFAEAGVKEVTLLGQNVNSYGRKENLCSFAELLELVNEVPGLLRIRFTTSHPKDLDDDLISAFNHLAKLCNHIHLPVQSGANTILKRMNRKYNRELYLDKIVNLRDTCPQIAITSDIIVGFPGETDMDFEETLKLIETVKFDGLFAFMYSDRPNAPAIRYSDKVPEPQKNERLQAVLALQENFTKMKNQAQIGSTQSILVEGQSKMQKPAEHDEAHKVVQWTGRTATNKIVNFMKPNNPANQGGIYAGELINVRIEKAFSHSLWGEPIQDGSPYADAGELKGEKIYAA
jgi:tRNA-2-methylthio-N6-dimethylallyladenosine synthase